MALGAEAYGRMLKKLLPPGVVWNLDVTSKLSKLFHAIGDEFARVGVRGSDLIEETDPRTATETLEDWERVLGLPDEDVTTIPVTDAERRIAITQKFTRLGGQSRAYFIAVALACGYVATIDDSFGLTVFRVGRGRVGERLRGAGWAFVWHMTVSPPAGTALSEDELERIIRRIAPAHTVVNFTFL